MPQAIEFWPLKLLSEVPGLHRDSISQSGSCLGSVRVHSLTLSYTPGSMWCDSRAFSWPAPLQPLGLGREPKAKVATFNLELLFFFDNLLPYKTIIPNMSLFSTTKTSHNILPESIVLIINFLIISIISVWLVVTLPITTTWSCIILLFIILILVIWCITNW
jgi:hypothetical protein